MNFKLNLRIKVFIIAVGIIVLGQIWYSAKNVKLYQKSYVSTLKIKCKKMAEFLKNDVERILSIGIPITKLIKMEKSLQEILDSAPELNFIEITDNKGYLLYFADHHKMEQIEQGKQRSLLHDSKTEHLTQKAGLTPDDTNIVLPILNKRKNIQAGFINLHISPRIIVDRSNQILFDMITVILTSLLITFEFLGFFVAFEISIPLEKLSSEMSYSIDNCSTIPGSRHMFMKELAGMVEKFNYHIQSLKQYLTPVTTTRIFFPKIEAVLAPGINKQLEQINSILKKSTKKNRECDALPVEKSLHKTSDLLKDLKQKAENYGKNLKMFSFFHEKREKSTYDATDDSHGIPYAFIRPFVFLFIMADGFSISFLPLFIDTLYQPIPGVPKEVILALPISLFMLIMAVGMPISGGVTDTKGWYRSLLAGTVINAGGHFLTGFSHNLTELILFRGITAVGFALVYMSCQRFIMDNTSVRQRAMGMSSFLAAFFSGDICGTVIGGMLVYRIGYSRIFFLSALFSLFAFAVALFVFHNSSSRKKKSVKSENSSNISFFKTIFMVFKDREFCSVLFFQAIPAKMVLVGFLFYFVPLYLQKINILQSNIGRMIICYGLSIVFLGPLFSKYLDKEHFRKYFIMTGGFITGISLCLFYVQPGAAAVLAIIFSLGIAQTFSVSSQAALISETALVRKLGPGKGMGIFRLWERVGNVTGPLVMGLLIAKTGYTFSLVILGGFSLFTSFMYLFFLNFRKKEPGTVKHCDIDLSG
ncbi:MAG: MFS transporter [Thermodesulfobacteriota bacterium]|nr:MFS transporter [Thermodesulfobacteriota bacterium]